MGLSEGQKGTLDVIKQQGKLAGVTHYFEGDYRGLILLIPFIILLLITYAGVVVGSIKLLKEKIFFDLAILLLPFAYSVLLPGSPSNPRFRVPVMPFLVILAAFGLVFLLVSFKNKKLHKT